jgi:DNA-binding HxlR family transcriptional regulator
MDTARKTVEPDLGPDLRIGYGLDCPSRTVVEVLAGKWSQYVLGLLRLEDRPMRFMELKRAVGGVTQKSLTQTLRSLERDGLVTRTIFPSVPPRVDYELTPLGRQIGELMGSITNWAVANAGRIHAAREEYDQRSE